MKSLSVNLGIILMGLAIFGYAEVWGADWKLYSTYENFLKYYDVQSVTRPSKNIVRVWERINYTDKGVTWWVMKHGPGFKDVSFSTVLNEINCIEKKLRILSLIIYDNKGEVISSPSSSSEWAFITTESMGVNTVLS
ncbi:MAG: surface-adhesin E family protein [Thermodesulfobacteriota bacterium]|jgi:hypothetical protein